MNSSTDRNKKKKRHSERSMYVDSKINCSHYKSESRKVKHHNSRNYQDKIKDNPSRHSSKVFEKKHRNETHASKPLKDHHHEITTGTSGRSFHNLPHQIHIDKYTVRKEENSKVLNVDLVTNKLFTTTSSSETTQESVLPSFKNAIVVNNSAKFVEQAKKRKLVWSNKKTDDSVVNKWEGAKFSEDSDGKVTSKFMRLMGIKSKQSDGNSSNSNEIVKAQEEMFSSMEHQYEVARQLTHTMRGAGFGFSSQNRQF